MSQFNTKYKFIDLRSSINQSRRNIENIMSRHIIIKLLESSEEKALSAVRKKKKNLYMQRNKYKNQSIFLVRFYESRRQWKRILSINIKKTKVNTKSVKLEFYTQRKYLLQMKTKVLRVNCFFQMLLLSKLGKYLLKNVPGLATKKNDLQ